MLQPYELAIPEFLEPIGYMLRHYMGVDVYFQAVRGRGFVIWLSQMLSVMIYRRN